MSLVADRGERRRLGLSGGFLILYLCGHYVALQQKITAQTVSNLVGINLVVDARDIADLQCPCQCRDRVCAGNRSEPLDPLRPASGRAEEN
jgi:hypothetical protein